MKKIKRVFKKGVRTPMRAIRALDRKVQKAFAKVFRMLYKVKFLRPVTKRAYRFTHYHPRIAASVLCVVAIAGVVIPILQPYIRSQRYELNAQSRALLGTADKDLTKKLTFDEKEQLFQFNKDAKKTSTTDGNPLEKLKSQVGGGGEDDNQLYSVDVAKDLSKGVTYYDNQMELSFKVTPQFSAMPGEQKDGHLIYPLNGTKGQLAYTVAAGGLKENMVLYESPGNDFEMEYKLDLPKSLEARLIPETGEVGIYSADPALFGNISYGSSDDQVRVESARNNSEKTYLTFKIPAPVVLGVGGTNQKSVAAVDSYFQLSGDTLRVVTKGLDKAEYPLSIDPTVTVDSSSDFQTGNMEDNNLSVNSGDLNRGTVTGGSLGSYSNGTLPTSTNRMFPASVAYNGYMYIMGGFNGTSDLNSVYYASINSSTGALGSWTAATNLPSTMRGHSAVVYNGYLYVIGGQQYSSYLNSVYYTPINTSNGSLGSWTATATFTTVRGFQGTVAYNGYMYILGGQTTGDNYLNNVQYAPINANGTLSAWQNTTVLTQVNSTLASVAYNGYMYVVGGDWGNGVQYAAINSDGTLGSWINTSNFTDPRMGLSASVYNGYIYVGAGWGGPGNGARLSDVQYARINANGSLDAWTTTTALPSARYFGASVAYNGYYYYFGGQTSSGPLNQIRYAAINPPGVVSGYASAGTGFTTARYVHSSVVYNGYVYVTGGFNGTALTSIQYAPINADGTIGSWTAGSLDVARYGHVALAYNGYMYVLGGATTGYANDVRKAPINSNGSLGTWTSAGTFNTGRYIPAATIYNGYMYVLGGLKATSSTACLSSGSSQYCNDIQYAPINGSGNVSGWTTSYFTTARMGLTAEAYGGYMYILGGNDGTNNLNDVRYAPINSNGSLGTWNTTNTFTTGRWGHSTVVNNGYIYITGGTGAGYYNDTQYAPINSNGTLGSWQSTSSFTNTRYYHTSVVYNGYLYIIGGYNGTTYNDIQYARINNGGSGAAGSWASAGTGFTTARSEFATVAYNGYLYVLGGYKSSTGTACSGSFSSFCNDVQYAPLNSNGTIGSWSAASSFTTPRAWLAAVAYNGYMYVSGGETPYLSDVQYAPINSATGNVTGWQSTTSLPYVRSAHAMVAYNGYMYAIGGYQSPSSTTCATPSSTSCNTVLYASIDSSDGTIGSWSTTTAFTTGRWDHASVAYNGYMYVSGGTADAMGVQYAPINSNGTLGSWQYTTSLPVSRSNHTMVAYDGYMYVLGGSNSNTVLYAPINANGTLGNWTDSSTFSTARSGHGSAVYNGYIYVTGGSAGSYLNDVQYAQLNVMPRKALYSKVIDLGTPGNVTNIAYTGTLPGDTKSITYRIAGTNGVFGSTRNISDGYSCSESATGQYIQLFVTLDDSQVGTFRDAANSNNAVINSISVESKPLIAPPDKRLRHGAWFLNDTLQPFTTTTDICS